MSNVLMAMRDSRVDAVVSLDGSLRNPKHPLQATPVDDPAQPPTPGPALEKVPAHPDYNPDKLTMPTFFAISKEIPDVLYEKIGMAPPKDRSHKFYEGLKYSDAYLFQFHYMAHWDFSSGLTRLMEGNPDLTSPLDKINQSHNMMSLYVHKFLDGYLKGDAAALEFLKKSPEDNGFTSDFVSKKFKAAKPAPLSYNEFIYRLKQDGAESLEQLHAEQVKRDPRYRMDPHILAYYAGKLAMNKEYKGAEHIFQVMLKMDPDNFNAMTSLAEIYETTGKPGEALALAEKAFKMRPYYTNLAKQIEKLKKQLAEKK